MKKNLLIKGFDIEPKYLKENTPKKGRISFLSLQTKPVCNARCLYCFSGPELGTKTKNPLTTEEYQDTIQQAKKLGAKTVVFPGIGEPTLDKKLPELISFVFDKKLTPVVYTNGLFEQNLVEIFHTQNTAILLKMDTLEPKHYKELVGPSYSKFKQNLDLILKTYKPKENKKNMTRLGVCSVVTNVNKGDIEKVAEFCRQNKIKHFVSGLAKVGWAKENWKILTEPKIKELNNIVSKHSTGVSSATIDLRCGLFAYGITIDANGDLIGCSTARWLRLGNIREKSLKKLIEIYRKTIWNDKQNYCLAREISLKKPALSCLC